MAQELERQGTISYDKQKITMGSYYHYGQTYTKTK